MVLLLTVSTVDDITIGGSIGDDTAVIYTTFDC
jgi:hypothetical protein